jgi:5'-nucleotidase
MQVPDKGGIPVHVLITNDDGIDSPGLAALALVARNAGHEVTVAAPSREFSGASAALTAVESDGRILVEPRTLPGLPGVTAWSVAASPAFIVLVALTGGLGAPPDLVLSGINIGANAGRAVTHSGTVGAALTAALGGCRAAAFSVGHSIRPPQQPTWETPATLAARLLPALEDIPPGVVLNVNCPDVPSFDQVRGVRRARLATFGAVQFTVSERGEGFLRMTLEDNEAALEEGSDEYYLNRQYATVTPIRPAAEAADIAVQVDDVDISLPV